MSRLTRRAVRGGIGSGQLSGNSVRQRPFTTIVHARDRRRSLRRDAIRIFCWQLVQNALIPVTGTGMSDLSGADDRARTGDLDLGKVALYQLSHVRVVLNSSPDAIGNRHRLTRSPTQ